MRVKKDSDSGQYCQYKQKGDGFYPMQGTVKTIPAGFYKPSQDSYSGEYFLQKKTIVTPKLYLLPNEAKDKIVADIQKFWKSEERYRKFQSVYKRNILLYSIPGNGKTCLINLMCKELIEKYDGVIICIDTHNDLSNYTKVMSKFRQVEPNRKIITIIEDFERLAKDDYYSALLLQLLDGNEQLDSVVTIATTNYPENLEKRWTCRPSRFNLILEYKKPNAEVRRYYMYNKLKDGGVDVDSDDVQKDIERYVGITEGYTFDFVKELIQGVYVDDIPEEQMIERIDAARKRNGRYNVTEDDGRKIGFNSGERGKLSSNKLVECDPSYIDEDDEEYEEYEEDDSIGELDESCQNTSMCTEGPIVRGFNPRADGDI